MDFTLSSEQVQIRDMARQFARQEIAPVAAEHDANFLFPAEVIKKARPLGLVNATLPAELGGSGLGALDLAIIAEELAWACSGIAVSVTMNNLVHDALHCGASSEQLSKYCGVLMDGFGFTGVMEKLGVERRLLTAGENKGMLDPFSPLPAKQRAFAQSMLDQIHQQFIAVVREGRGKRLKETPEMFSGLFWNGEEAVKMGLADDFGNLDYVAREVVKAEEVLDYTPRDNVAERLAKRFGAAIGSGAVKALREMSPIR